MRAWFPDAAHGWVLYSDAASSGFTTGCSNGALLTVTGNGGVTLSPVGRGEEPDSAVHGIH